jgi:hypothetical protein
MRVIVVAAVALLVAWAADRLLADAVMNAGTYAGGDGSAEFLLAADRIPKLVILGLLGWLAVDVLRGGVRFASLLLVVAGLVLGVLPSLVLLARYEPLMPIVSQELFWPRQFVMWTASGLLIIGVVGALGGGGRWGLRAGPWVRAGVAVGLIALCWPADALLSELFVGAADGRTVEAMLIYELVVRTSVLAALFALCALTLDADRSAGPAGLMTAAGAVVFIGFALVALLMRPVGPDQAPAVIVTGFLARWMSGGVMLIGLWELVMIRRGAAAGRATAADRTVVAA